MRLASKALIPAILMLVVGCGSDEEGTDLSDQTPPSSAAPSNSAPTATISGARSVVEGGSITLDGSTSSDPEGDDLTFLWEQISGPEVTLTSFSSSSLTFLAPDVGGTSTIEIQLTVSDSSNLKSITSALITVQDNGLTSQGEGLVETISTNELTASETYTSLGTADAEGMVEITDVLVGAGYIEASEERYFIEVLDSSEEPVPNVELEFAIESSSDTLHLRAVDPSRRLNTKFQSEDIVELLNEANSGSELALFLPGARLLLRLVMRSLRVVEFAETSLSVLDLFSLDIRFHRYNDELYLEGTVGEFYSAFSAVRSLALPITMRRFVRASSATQRVAVSRAFDPDSRRSDDTQLIAYLQNVGGYLLANSDTQIRVKLNKVNGRDRFFTIEVVDEDTPVSSDLYDVTINIEGFLGESYDAGGGDPDYAGWMVIRGTTFEFVMERNALEANQTIPRVPIQEGETITVSVFDEDLFFDDELHEFQFDFTGEAITSSSELVIVNIDFERYEEIVPVGEAESYDVEVQIEGSLDGDFDPGNDAPDFFGTIEFDDVLVELDTVDDQFNVTYSFTNVMLRVGDTISMVLEDEDFIFDDDVIEFSFQFDGTSYNTSNSRVTVTFVFVKNE